MNEALMIYLSIGGFVGLVGTFCAGRYDIEVAENRLWDLMLFWPFIVARAVWRLAQ